MSGISVRTGTVPTQRGRDTPRPGATAQGAATSGTTTARPGPRGPGTAVVRACRAGARDVLRGLERHWATMSIWRL